MNCSRAYGPDLFMRIPMYPYFPQPYGQDCYFSYIGYDIFGGISLFLVAITTIVHLVTLTENVSQVHRLTLSMHVLTFVCCAVTIILGWVAPHLFSIGFTFFPFLFVVTYLCNLVIFGIQDDGVNS